ncbi:hypothetical protein Theco_2783 [Thermobacillus composti KWC4]|uniref:Pyrrolo-quinoline quinone repeat domain-containing protein n=2 Tax=Thermobacillus TaxID=76632 RepID=L0EGG6_THECK|nr:hypothetical protein Theco_2783 [Thermobacillus composti KWC4]
MDEEMGDVRWRRHTVVLMMSAILLGALATACLDGGNERVRCGNAAGAMAEQGRDVRAADGVRDNDGLPGGPPDAAFADSDPAEIESYSPEPAPSVDPDWVWRYQGKLAFHYLLGATDEELLLRGDDGGFSGLHQDSTIYALDRGTGELLWSIDAGSGWADAEVDPERSDAAVLTHYDPDAGQHEERIRRLRLRDGAVLWEQVLPKGHGSLRLAAGAVIYAVPPENAADGDGKLRVYHADTGRLMWEREYAESFRVLNRPGDPYVLVQHERTLTAYRPADGKRVWELEAGNPPGPDLQPFENVFTDARTDRFSSGSRIRWAAFGSSIAKIDMVQGLVEAVYPVNPGEYVTAFDGRWLLIERSPDDEAGRFETVLYDSSAGREQWKLPGRGSGAVVEGSRVYLLLDGIPAAFDLDSGRMVWKTAYIGPLKSGWRAPVSPLVAGDALLMPYGEDLLVLDVSDGRVLRRLRDVRIDYPDGREEDTKSGLINRDASGDIYLGSSNGCFSRLRLPQPISR